VTQKQLQRLKVIENGRREADRGEAAALLGRSARQVKRYKSDFDAKDHRWGFARQLGAGTIEPLSRSDLRTDREASSRKIQARRTQPDIWPRFARWSKRTASP